MKLYPLKKMPILRMTLDSRLNWEEHIKSQSKESIKYYKSGSQIYNSAFAGKLKKLYSIHREGIRIYTGAFRSSPVEAKDPTLELRRNKLGLRFL